ncbi:hypothetical protein CONLIGDRAFT_680083 [Coniochaeta ligniaria NRRL 30616]|uniref:Uncharacterized protein n=1 Tax=Coniochaeta ligniaria NRRL 30616 TaxID=1408157 RepID=A0A1J7JDG6_9PEZI|nr:hypothetical protein CONLIGDRAFT_680083 [Coniochaeta ligniaria NRRL 30616]
MAPSHSEESNRPAETIKPGKNIVHGSAGDQDLPSKVDRADKTAPLPEHEHGGAIPGMNASGGGSQGLAQGPTRGQGKGPLKPGV